MLTAAASSTTPLVTAVVLKPLPARFQPGLQLAFAALPGLQVSVLRPFTVLRQAPHERPNLALLCLQHESRFAASTVHELWARLALPTLVLSLVPSDAQLQSVLVPGFRGYLPWPTAPQAFFAAIELAVSGHMVYGPGITPRPVPVQAPPQAPVARQDLLTPREKVVLAQIAAGKHNSEIAPHINRSTKVVEAIITQLLRKLELRSRVDMAAWWLKHGQQDGPD